LLKQLQDQVHTFGRNKYGGPTPQSRYIQLRTEHLDMPKQVQGRCMPSSLNSASEAHRQDGEDERDVKGEESRASRMIKERIGQGFDVGPDESEFPCHGIEATLLNTMFLK